MTISTKKLLFWSGLLALAFFSLLMLRITLPYLSFENKVGFLMLKQQQWDIEIWRMAFYLHVLTSMFALLAGFTQFSKYLQRTRKDIHRFIGRIYVVVILGISGPSGLVMALYARGGWISGSAFTLLSILWIYFTLQAYMTARSGNFKAHRAFMIRSYALTLSAITLRSWKWLLVLLFEPRPLTVYLIVAWLGFIPNLLVAEWIIHKKRGRQATPLKKSS